MRRRMKVRKAKKSVNSYRADLTIDPTDLDNEILRQPQLYYDWSQAAAEAEVDRDEAKEDLDIAMIDVEDKVRTKPHLYFTDDESQTEQAIKVKVHSHRKVKRLRAVYHEALRAFKLLRKAENAFEQRKRMIESYLYHYHKMVEGEVNVPRVPGTYEKRMNKRTSERIKRQLQTKRKRK